MIIKQFFTFNLKRKETKKILCNSKEERIRIVKGNFKQKVNILKKLKEETKNNFKNSKFNLIWIKTNEHLK